MHGPTPRPTPRQRLRYRFDNTMTRGTPALIGWLAAVSVALVIALSTLLVVVDDRRPTAPGAAAQIWRNAVHAFDLGDAARGGWLHRAGVIGLALAGLFFAGALVGLLTSGVHHRIDGLRKGRTAVLKKGHTVIIGWSDQVFPMVAELAGAGAGRRCSPGAPRPSWWTRATSPRG
ncbi:hypothetical protein AB0L06_38190 [Spirillospora sp. NPDC052269]